MRPLRGCTDNNAAISPHLQLAIHYLIRLISRRLCDCLGAAIVKEHVPFESERAQLSQLAEHGEIDELPPPIGRTQASSIEPSQGREGSEVQSAVREARAAVEIERSHLRKAHDEGGGPSAVDVAA